MNSAKVMIEKRYPAGMAEHRLKCFTDENFYLNFSA